MALVRIGLLPAEPLAAAAHFHTHELPEIEAALATADVVTLVFAPADHTHRGWRRAVVQSLARAHAPKRINAVEADTDAAIDAGEWLLATNGGVTGQLLPLDSAGAGSKLC